MPQIATETPNHTKTQEIEHERLKERGRGKLRAGAEVKKRGHMDERMGSDRQGGLLFQKDLVVSIYITHPP